MRKLVYEVALLDIVLLLALYLVLGDLAWRVQYAESDRPAALHGYAASFSYSLFTRFFTMTGSGVSLTSPPALDWVQVIALVLILVNAWFVYVVVKERGKLFTGSL